MRHSLRLSLWATLAWSGVAGAQSSEAETSASVAAEAAVPEALQRAIAGSWREPANVARDRYRHPGPTLAFFGIKPSDTVVEITPGNGWYSEILAPYLSKDGRYVAAVVDPAAEPEGKRDYPTRARDTLEKKYAAAPQQYAKTALVAYASSAPVLGPKNSADTVLTFRNVHNWRMAGTAETMFKAFFDVLKPGGTLGVVEHRANRDVGDDDKSGYVSEQQVQALAEAAGFKLAGKSEVNANPRDTKDYPGGVWTLPPSNRHDPVDDAKYQGIGESDRMTLKFVKPAA